MNWIKGLRKAYLAKQIRSKEEKRLFKEEYEKAKVEAIKYKAINRAEKIKQKAKLEAKEGGVLMRTVKAAGKATFEHMKKVHKRNITTGNPYYQSAKLKKGIKK